MGLEEVEALGLPEVYTVLEAVDELVAAEANGVEEVALDETNNVVEELMLKEVERMPKVDVVLKDVGPEKRMLVVEVVVLKLAEKLLGLLKAVFEEMVDSVLGVLNDAMGKVVDRVPEDVEPERNKLVIEVVVLRLAENVF